MICREHPEKGRVQLDRGGAVRCATWVLGSGCRGGAPVATRLGQGASTVGFAPAVGKTYRIGHPQPSPRHSGPCHLGQLRKILPLKRWNMSGITWRIPWSSGAVTRRPRWLLILRCTCSSGWPGSRVRVQAMARKLVQPQGGHQALSAPFRCSAAVSSAGVAVRCWFYFGRPVAE